MRERTGSSNDELKVDPGNPDNDPNYKSSPTYFLGLRKPLVAAINGAAAGLDSATQPSDMLYGTQAKIVTSFGPRGLIAEHGTSWMLPRIVGPSNVDGEEAYRMGYANRLCEDGAPCADLKKLHFCAHVNHDDEAPGLQAPES